MQLAQARHRHEARRARADMRAWAVTRRTRTRQLIELGGLVQNAELAVLAGDDRALLYGAFLELAARLRGSEGAGLARLYRARGARALANDAEQAAARAAAIQERSDTGKGGAGER